LPQPKTIDAESHSKHNPFPNNEDEESNDFFEVNGVLFFFAFKLPSQESLNFQSKDENTAMNDLSTNELAPPDYQVFLSYE
jgi:hypothetical protein